MKEDVNKVVADKKWKKIVQCALMIDAEFVHDRAKKTAFLKPGHTKKYKEWQNIPAPKISDMIMEGVSYLNGFEKRGFNVKSWELVIAGLGKGCKFENSAYVEYLLDRKRETKDYGKEAIREDFAWMEIVNYLKQNDKNIPIITSTCSYSVNLQGPEYSFDFKAIGFKASSGKKALIDRARRIPGLPLQYGDFVIASHILLEKVLAAAKLNNLMRTNKDEKKFIKAVGQNDITRQYIFSK